MIAQNTPGKCSHAGLHYLLLCWLGKATHGLSFGRIVNRIMRVLVRKRRIGKTTWAKSKYVFTKTKRPYGDAHAISSWAQTQISYTAGPCTTQDHSCIP